jgi:hypothetical protein
MDTIDEFGGAPAGKRPTFITVLCILTFVGCGIYLISSVYGLITFEQNKKMTMALINGDNNVFGGLFQQVFSMSEKDMKNFFDWSLYNHFANLLNTATCLTGALMMWKLRRMGFYIYAVGTIFPIITSIGLWMAAQDAPMLGTGAAIGAIFMIVVSIGFVVMYGLNLKHMRNGETTVL